MREPLEIERRFLIRRPSEETLRRQGGEESRIVQDYLRSPEGVTLRVRARTDDSGTVYTRTEKRRLTDMTRVEVETVLTEAEYRAALSERDPALRTVEKTRWRIPCAGRVLEADLFPFWEDRALLEIELPEETASFSLPAWLSVVREVTQDRRYTNRALAAAVPEEEI